MYKEVKKDYTLAMNNAEASVRMEGCTVTDEMREQCAAVLSGETTVAELLKQYRATDLENALASTAMEGFPITEQTRHDCTRLLNGGITMEKLVKEILER